MVKFPNQYYVEYALTKTAVIKAKNLQDLARILTTQIPPKYIYTPAEMSVADRRAYKYTATDGRMYFRNSVISATWIFAFSKSEVARAKKRADKVRKMVKVLKERKK